MLEISEREIVSEWKKDMINPIVSIRCLTYNHEKYIEEALIGFLRQKTKFPFEIIIHDDASTDKTAEIIRKYEKKYPSIIKPIYETENQYSKRDGTITKKINAKMKGKYIAFCEGDDYWIDEYKLQKQIDFLENNPDYEMCYTNFDIQNDVLNTYQKDLFKTMPQKYKSEYTLAEWIINMGYVAPMTWVYNRILFDDYIMMKSCDKSLQTCDGTFTMFAFFLSQTKVKCLFDDTTAVYRICAESASHSFNPKKIYHRENNLMNVSKQLINKYKLDNKYLKIIEQNYYTNKYKLICILGSREERKKCCYYNKGVIFNLLYIFTSFKIGKNIFIKIYSFGKYIKNKLKKVINRIL